MFSSLQALQCLPSFTYKLFFSTYTNSLTPCPSVTILTFLYCLFSFNLPTFFFPSLSHIIFTLLRPLFLTNPLALVFFPVPSLTSLHPLVPSPFSFNKSNTSPSLATLHPLSLSLPHTHTFSPLSFHAFALPPSRQTSPSSLFLSSSFSHATFLASYASHFSIFLAFIPLPLFLVPPY